MSEIIKTRGTDGRYLPTFGLPAILDGVVIPAKDAHDYWHYTYVVRDPVTGEWYGGVHSTRRLRDGYSGSGRWVRDHPERDRLLLTVVAFHPSHDSACLAENALVALDDPLCSNLIPGGTSGSRPVGDPTIRAEISAARKRLYRKRVTLRNHMAEMTRAGWDNPETRAKLVAHRQRLWADPELREKMTPLSVRNKGKPLPPEWVAKLCAAAKLRPVPHEFTSEGALARWQRPGFREKASAAIKAAHNTDEARAAHSSANRKRWADPEYKARVGAAISAAIMQNDETRAARSEANRERWADPEYKARVSAAIRAAMQNRRAA